MTLLLLKQLQLAGKMQTTIRRVGNAKAVLLPGAFIKQIGFDDVVEMTIEGDATVLRKPRRTVRVGKAAASRKLAASGDDVLVLPEFANAEDANWVW